MNFLSPISGFWGPLRPGIDFNHRVVVPDDVFSNMERVIGNGIALLEERGQRFCAASQQVVANTEASLVKVVNHAGDKAMWAIMDAHARADEWLANATDAGVVFVREVMWRAQLLVLSSILCLGATFTLWAVPFLGMVLCMYRGEPASQCVFQVSADIAILFQELWSSMRRPSMIQAMLMMALAVTVVYQLARVMFKCLCNAVARHVLSIRTVYTENHVSQPHAGTFQHTGPFQMRLVDGRSYTYLAPDDGVATVSIIGHWETAQCDSVVAPSFAVHAEQDGRVIEEDLAGRNFTSFHHYCLSPTNREWYPITVKRHIRVKKGQVTFSLLAGLHHQQNGQSATINVHGVKFDVLFHRSA